MFSIDLFFIPSKISSSVCDVKLKIATKSFAKQMGLQVTVTNILTDCNCSRLASLTFPFVLILAGTTFAQ